ncbi:hypothetical protein ABK046_38280 [Streptomyces caeruleatus]
MSVASAVCCSDCVWYDSAYRPLPESNFWRAPARRAIRPRPPDHLRHPHDDSRGTAGRALAVRASRKPQPQHDV